MLIAQKKEKKPLNKEYCTNISDSAVKSCFKQLFLNIKFALFHVCEHMQLFLRHSYHT